MIPKKGLLFFESGGQHRAVLSKGRGLRRLSDGNTHWQCIYTWNRLTVFIVDPSQESHGIVTDDSCMTAKDDVEGKNGPHINPG